LAFIVKYFNEIYLKTLHTRKKADEYAFVEFFFL